MQPHSTAVAEQSLRETKGDVELEEHLRLRGAAKILPLFGFQNSQCTGFCPVFKIYEPNPAETKTVILKKNHPELELFIDLFVFPLGLSAC